jgi:ABC-type microcin C transport system permease subunit YejB
MRNFVLALSLLPSLALPALGQSKPAGPLEQGSSPQASEARSRDNMHGEAAKSQAEQERKFRRSSERAKRAVDSMCVECVGARYNRPASRTPLIVPDDTSDMEPDLELEAGSDEP